MNDPTDEELRARFRPLIEAELAALSSASETTGSDRRPVELDQQSVGRLSRMDAIQGQAMAAALEARRAARRLVLTQALGRMETDEYGYCADCGNFIGRKRLETDPAATRCIDCAR
ncbi:TraR/DksA family transcriptional regulator [Albidovulum inexpectatum]|uniref:TraR/DksA family transcriptional regulator n=1 Tax=Albidovulum inexpectatum TaxID=196587 RepID=A0A2S5JIT1_9RHOB|nr:TraR/DksA C4-type zinc finger protein [Albidovulum inexpectatum]PPB81332.1 TraR/DksA family transcriptional regulator [Albidovulum inexpectatum]